MYRKNIRIRASALFCSLYTRDVEGQSVPLTEILYTVSSRPSVRKPRLNCREISVRILDELWYFLVETRSTTLGKVSKLLRDLAFLLRRQYRRETGAAASVGTIAPFVDAATESGTVNIDVLLLERLRDCFENWSTVYQDRNDRIFVVCLKQTIFGTIVWE